MNEQSGSAFCPVISLNLTANVRLNREPWSYLLNDYSWRKSDQPGIDMCSATSPCWWHRPSKLQSHSFNPPHEADRRHHLLTSTRMSRAYNNNQLQ